MTDDEYDDTQDSTVELELDDVIYFMGFMMDGTRRNYDVLLTILHTLSLGTSNEGKAKELQELHEQGKFLYPPLYVEDDDENR